MILKTLTRSLLLATLTTTSLLAAAGDPVREAPAFVATATQQDLIDDYATNEANYHAFHATNLVSLLGNRAEGEKAEKEREAGMEQWQGPTHASYDAAKNAGVPEFVLRNAAHAKQLALGISGNSDAPRWRKLGL